MPSRAVASCVECSKQHAPTRAATSRWQRWDWQVDTTHHPPNPSTGSLACPLVSGAAAALGRSSSAPDETVCLASRLANWACDAVSAKNSNSYQLATRRLVEETGAMPPCRGGMNLRAPSRPSFVFLTACFWSTSLPVAFPFCHRGVPRMPRIQCPSAPFFSPNLGVPRANLSGVLWRRWRELAPRCIAPRMSDVSPRPGQPRRDLSLWDGLPGPTGWLPIGKPLELCRTIDRFRHRGTECWWTVRAQSACALWVPALTFGDPWELRLMVVTKPRHSKTSTRST